MLLLNFVIKRLKNLIAYFKITIYGKVLPVYEVNCTRYFDMKVNTLHQTSKLLLPSYIDPTGRSKTKLMPFILYFLF